MSYHQVSDREKVATDVKTLVSQRIDDNEWVRGEQMTSFC